ncbi:hypothetical protein ACJJTC_018437 [Scirpophaga incertulas]
MTLTFDGRLRSDGLLFEAGDKCSSFADEAACVAASAYAARACVWHLHKQTCLPCWGSQVGERVIVSPKVRYWAVDRCPDQSPSPYSDSRTWSINSVTTPEGYKRTCQRKGRNRRIVVILQRVS